MPFPRRLLAAGEELILDLRPHGIALVAPIAATLVILAGVGFALGYMPDSWDSWVRWLVVVAGVILFVAWPLPRIVAWATSHFVLTSDRLVHRSGWIAKHSMEIPLENVNDVRFHQSVFERLIGAGDLIIESAGEHGQQVFSDIRHPEGVQKLIYETSEANQQRMVSHGHQGGRSMADELAKLDRLRADGVLTDEEFRVQKARLLGDR